MRYDYVMSDTQKRAMNDRDALAELLNREDEAPVPESPEEWKYRMADAILAAGWRPLRFDYQPCDEVHPKYGRCAMWLGHDGTHWTHEYDDERRPDGSHPWDY